MNHYHPCHVSVSCVLTRSHLIIAVSGLAGADSLTMGRGHNLLAVTAHIGHRVPGQPGLRANTLTQLRPPEDPVTRVTRACHAGHAHAHSEVLQEVVTVCSVSLTLVRTHHKPLTLSARPLLQEGKARAIEGDLPFLVTLTVLGKLYPGFRLDLVILCT